MTIQINNPMRLNIILFTLTGLFVSCQRTACPCGEHDVFFSRMFVSCYHRMESIFLEKGVGEESDFIYIKYNVSPFASIADEDLTHINRLAEKHRDTDYNREIMYAAGSNFMCATFGGRYGITPDIAKISIKSNNDFDVDHPAGTPLNDIVRLYATTVYPYIKSGYTETFDWSSDTTGCFHYLGCGTEDFPINALLSEINAEDLIMAGGNISYSNYGKLKFSKSPNLSKKHLLTVEMASDGGRIFEASLDVAFD